MHRRLQNNHEMDHTLTVVLIHYKLYYKYSKLKLNYINIIFTCKAIII